MVAKATSLLGVGELANKPSLVAMRNSLNPAAREWRCAARLMVSVGVAGALSENIHVGGRKQITVNPNTQPCQCSRVSAPRCGVVNFFTTWPVHFSSGAIKALRASIKNFARKSSPSCFRDLGGMIGTTERQKQFFRTSQTYQQ